jgi:hypothetical protein
MGCSNVCSLYMTAKKGLWNVGLLNSVQGGQLRKHVDEIGRNLGSTERHQIPSRGEESNTCTPRVALRHSRKALKTVIINFNIFINPYIVVTWVPSGLRFAFMTTASRRYLSSSCNVRKDVKKAVVPAVETSCLESPVISLRDILLHLAGRPEIEKKRCELPHS